MQKTGVTFLFGLVGTEAVAAECRDGVAYTETWQPWWSVIVTGLTFYLITPWKGEWACAQPAAQRASRDH